MGKRILARAGRRGAIGLLSVLTVLAIAVGFAPRLGAAPPIWERQINTTGDFFVLTDPGANVSVGCINQGSSANAIETITPDNDSTAVPASTSPYPLLCEGISAVGVDGTLYSVAYVSQTGQNYLAAYDNGAMLWSMVPPDTCPGVLETVNAIQMGADGNIYMVSNRNGGCTGREYFLSKISPSGDVLFNVSLGNSYGLNGPGLMPYETGIALLGGFPFKLSYYNYQGELLAPGTITIALAADEVLVRNAYTHLGRVYAMIAQNRQTTPECPISQPATRIVAFDQAGPVTDQYTIDSCVNGGQLRALPGGGAVFGIYSATGAPEQTIALDSALTEDWRYAVDAGTIDGRTFGIGHDLFVDTNDHVIVFKRYSRESQRYGGVELDMVNSGVRQSITYTEEFDPLASFSVQPQYIGLAPGRLYVGAIKCGAFTCSTNDQHFLYNVPTEGLALDYPRGVILGLPEPPPPPPVPLTYVALGDSYSSGEGVPPFYADTVGLTNNCHRSPLAYGPLLQVKTDNKVHLSGFFACSGAVTDNLWKKSQYSTQPPQLDSLSGIPNIDFVTLTIGGNDIDFAGFASTCATDSDSKCAKAFVKSMKDIDKKLPKDLNKALFELRGRLSAQATVFVLGYPQLVTGTDVLDCEWFTPYEQALGRALTTALNDKIKERVLATGDSRLNFISAEGVTSPFFGHELCSAEPYFNGIVPLPNLVYSFHPNQKGQKAYAKLIKAELLARGMLE